MYKVVILNAEPRTQTVHMFDKKPTFKELYPLINCDIIEIQQGIENGKIVDMYCDEESKLKEPIKYNEIATDMWYIVTGKQIGRAHV